MTEVSERAAGVEDGNLAEMRHVDIDDGARINVPVPPER